MQQSELYKATKSLNDTYIGLFGILSAVLLVAGLFMGGWQKFLIVIVGIVLGFLLEVALHNRCSAIYNWLTRSAGWVPYEVAFSRQMASVLSRKLLITAAKYLYFLMAIFFVLKVDSNFQVMALSVGLMALLATDYDQTADNFDQDHELPSLRSIMLEYLFLLLALLGISVARYFYTVKFVWVLAPFSVAFILTNMLVVTAWRKAYREKGGHSS